MTTPRAALAAALLTAAVSAVPAAPAKAQARGQGPQGPPPVVSPEISTDRRVTVRVYAPKAEAVRLDASDIPGVPFGAGAPMTKGTNGVWEATLGPVPAGAYRYAFVIDGVPTIDPRNPSTSEANLNAWSLIYVPGSDLFDTRPVPRGAVAEVTYYSDSLHAFRRMHVYTPPGYETSGRRYPVLYLLHGAGDSDHSWSTAGRAGFILDNLMARKAAKDMVVVMPAGHTRAPADNPISTDATAAFAGDFSGSIVPYIERHYRVSSGRDNTAIAGLSMGGGQTLEIAMLHPQKFGYVGVFSSGLFGVFAIPGRGAPPPAPWTRGSSDWEKRHAAALADDKVKKGLKLLWFSTGKDDFLVQISRSTVDLLKAYGYAPVYEESEGGHTWINWRDYLTEFAPQLFK